MTASWCGKPPTFPWRGSKAQWDQERSDQIRVGEAIFPGFEALNPIRYPIMDSQADKDKRAKWMAEKKRGGKPAVIKKVRKTEEYIDASKLGLADFM